MRRVTPCAYCRVLYICQIDVHLATHLAGGSQDPGTQTTWNSLVRAPTEVLHLSTGIPAATWAEYKKLPLVIAPGTGGEACLKRCGLNFTQVRSHSTCDCMFSHAY